MRSRAFTLPVGRFAVTLLLVLAGLAAVSTQPASAATTVTAVWNFGGAAEYVTPLCSQHSTYNYGQRALEVYNPCSTRVWLHYHDYAAGKIYAYCVNPHGALAYHFAYPFDDLQISSNTSPCDIDDELSVSWLPTQAGLLITVDLYACSMGKVEYLPGWSIVTVINTCATRVWIHEHDDGSGAAVCINPGGSYGVGSATRLYWQVQVTFNQAPCSAGGAPYPY